VNFGERLWGISVSAINPTKYRAELATAAPDESPD
jgi:hypothetical protein